MPDQRLLASKETRERHAEHVYAFVDEEVADSAASADESVDQDEQAPPEAARIGLTEDTSSDEDSDVEIVLEPAAGAAAAPRPPKTRNRQRLVFVADLAGKLAKACADPDITATCDPMLCPFISNKSPRHLVRLDLHVPAPSL